MYQIASEQHREELHKKYEHLGGVYKWTTISDISTLVIAIFAGSNFVLALSIRNLNKKQQKEFTDSLQALVVATIVTAGRLPEKEDSIVLSAKAYPIKNVIENINNMDFKNLL